uniref:Homing endonuclease LAGLIDADG domain-containing protein n=1 Tax=Saccharomyces paradoxus TaxID=27291 RepID=A0A0H3WHG8_SACPA|nr:hypothetical protein [Saccharomyces paradoxus]
MLSDYFYTLYIIDEVFNNKNIYLKSKFYKHKTNIYNTPTWKTKLLGFTNTNNIKMLPIINNFIFISFGPQYEAPNPMRMNLYMDNKSLIKTDNKLYNNTLFNKIKDTTYMYMNHFKNWLSGFVVGDGYFGIKKNMTHSFNIT